MLRLPKYVVDRMFSKGTALPEVVECKTTIGDGEGSDAYKFLVFVKDGQHYSVLRWLDSVDSRSPEDLVECHRVQPRFVVEWISDEI